MMGGEHVILRADFPLDQGGGRLLFLHSHRFTWGSYSLNGYVQSIEVDIGKVPAAISP